MRAGKSASLYGRLQSQANPQAAAIYRARHQEPELCEPAGFACWYEHDPRERENDIDGGARLWKAAEEGLSRKEFHVLACRLRKDMTLDEVAATLRLTRERARQIEQKVLRKISRPEFLASAGIRRTGRWWCWA